LPRQVGDYIDRILLANFMLEVLASNGYGQQGASSYLGIYG